MKSAYLKQMIKSSVVRLLSLKKIYIYNKSNIHNCTQFTSPINVFLLKYTLKLSVSYMAFEKEYLNKYSVIYRVFHKIWQKFKS